MATTKFHFCKMFNIQNIDKDAIKRDSIDHEKVYPVIIFEFGILFGAALGILWLICNSSHHLKILFEFVSSL